MREVTEQMTKAFVDLFKDYPAADSIAHQLVDVGSGSTYGEVK